MADDESDNGEDEEDEPIVELGEKSEVEGVPLAQVASRLTWGMGKSDLRERAGDTVIRTPGGPRELGDVLDEVDVPYFERRQEFTDHVRGVLDTGPVPTADREE